MVQDGFDELQDIVGTFDIARPTRSWPLCALQPRGPGTDGAIIALVCSGCHHALSLLFAVVGYDGGICDRLLYKHLRKLFRKSLDNIFRAENSAECGRIAPTYVVFVLWY
ncbi:MAG: hypothetical protein DID90_2727553580 [Candidatus Nitrotoga sp. LAW]|nr:MAG: hypothetical protein DID90_2727553580 [Candidatus Nitrotoga sp. LAW]